MKSTKKNLMRRALAEKLAQDSWNLDIAQGKNFTPRHRRTQEWDEWSEKEIFGKFPMVDKSFAVTTIKELSSKRKAQRERKKKARKKRKQRGWEEAEVRSDCWQKLFYIFSSLISLIPLFVIGCAVLKYRDDGGLHLVSYGLASVSALVLFVSLGVVSVCAKSVCNLVLFIALWSLLFTSQVAIIVWGVLFGDYEILQLAPHVGSEKGKVCVNSICNVRRKRFAKH